MTAGYSRAAQRNRLRSSASNHGHAKAAAALLMLSGKATASQPWGKWKRIPQFFAVALCIG